MPKIVREVRVPEITEDLKVGETLTPEVFSVGDQVQVTGTSKGKGWAGTIKRHNFHRQRATHGGKGNTRKVGSIGSMYPQRIFKGKKMAGQMGHERVTVKNLKIALVDTEHKCHWCYRVPYLVHVKVLFCVQGASIIMRYCNIYKVWHQSYNCRQTRQSSLWCRSKKPRVAQASLCSLLIKWSRWLS